MEETSNTGRVSFVRVVIAGAPRTATTVGYVLALLAPGQGSQTPGMLTPWLELPGARERLAWMSTVSGLDLERLGTTASAEEIKDTAVTQPLIVALGLLACAELDLDNVAVTAGHSIGEITAAAAAGVLTSESAIALAAVRGREMAAACGTTATGMSAVLGGDPDEVLQTLADLGLDPANRNGAGQVVAAGPVDALAKLADAPPARARVVPLAVAGAFHTRFMAPARDALAAIATGVTVADPGPLLLSNADGAAVPGGSQMLQRLVEQVTAPVRWDLCQDTLAHLGVTAAIELPPAGTLTGLAKRHFRGTDIELLPLKTPDDLPAARELLNRSAPAIDSHTPDWRVVVSPVKGTFHPDPHREGDHLAAGVPLGRVVGRRDESPVSAGYDGVLAEWIAIDGDLVGAGQPLALIYPGGNS